jgi:hypothetical protein
MTRHFALLLCACSLAGCATYQMVVPPDIASASEPLAVTERSTWSGSLADESFKLGPYAVSDVSRKANTTLTTHMAVRTDDRSGGFTYSLSGDGLTMNGDCETRALSRGSDFSGPMRDEDSLHNIQCTCRDGSGMAELMLAPLPGRYEGMLRTAARQYKVASINEHSGGASTLPTGFRVDGDAPTGAVDILGTGRAWISRSLAGRERVEIACVFAGLLLDHHPE